MTEWVTHYEKEIEILNDHNELLQKQIDNNKIITAMNIQLYEMRISHRKYVELDKEWLEWIEKNQWIKEWWE